MVVLIERLLPDDGAADPVSLADLNVLVLLSGRERTLREYGNLLARAGLRLNRVIGSAPPFSLSRHPRVWQLPNCPLVAHPKTPPYYDAEALPDQKWVEVSEAGEAAFRKRDAEAKT